MLDVPIPRLMAAGTLMIATSVAAAAPTASRLETVKVADGIWAFVAAEPKTGLVTGNQILVVGGDAALLFDAGHFPRTSERVVAEIKRLTPRPVRFLAISHFHGDHLLGAPPYLEAWPKLEVVAHAQTLREIEKNGGADFIVEQRKKFPEFVARQKQALVTRKKPDGSPLPEGDLEHQRLLVSDAEAYVTEMERMRYVPPALTFESGITVHLGGRQVQLHHLGRGNTAGDIVAYVPDARVLMTGDLLVAPTPYGIGSFFEEWPSTLAKLERFDATAIVPGHGKVQRDFSYARLVSELIEATRARVAQSVKAGLSLEDTLKQVTLDDFKKRFAGDDPWRRRHFADYWVAPAVKRLYKLETGELKE